MSVKIYTKEERNKERQIAKEVNKLSVAEIATNLYGLTLYSKNNNKRYMECYEHPSMVFDMQKNLVFYNAKTTNGMNAYDFVAFYENSGFDKAREKVNEYYMERDPRNLLMYQYNKQKDTVYQYTGVMMPRANAKGFPEMYNYFEKKGIGRETVDLLVDNSLIYQSEVNNNIVFMGFDENDTLSFGVEYGSGEKPYKAECLGSYSRIGWTYMPNNDSENVANVAICSSPMDAVALLSISDPNITILCPKDLEHLQQTMEYAMKNYEWMQTADEFILCLNDEKAIQTADVLLSNSLCKAPVRKFSKDDILDVFLNNLDTEVSRSQLEEVEFQTSLLNYLNDLDQKVEVIQEEQELETYDAQELC